MRFTGYRYCTNSVFQSNFSKPFVCKTVSFCSVHLNSQYINRHLIRKHSWTKTSNFHDFGAVIILCLPTSNSLVDALLHWNFSYFCRKQRRSGYAKGTLEKFCANEMHTVILEPISTNWNSSLVEFLWEFSNSTEFWVYLMGILYHTVFPWS